MPDLLTAKQVGEYLQLSQRSIYRLLERGELPATKIGGQWRFRKAAIDEWIEHRNQNPKPFKWTASAKSILAKHRRAKKALAIAKAGCK